MTRASTARRLRVVGIAMFALVALGVFVWFQALAGVDLLPHATYTFHARSPNVVALSDHADVVEAGVKVGTVSGIGEAGGLADLTLTLARQYGPVYRDAQIEIGAKTLAGENYVALDPGSPAAGALPDGATLPAIAPEATQLDQILSTFDAARRRDVQRLLDLLGAGLGGRGQELNALLGGAAAVVDDALPVTEVLAADRTQVASLVDDFGTVAASLGRRTAAIRVLVHAALVAGTAVAHRDADLTATLRVLPGFVAQARDTIGQLGTFSQIAAPVVRDLALAASALVPAIGVLRPAAAEGRAVLAELTPFASISTRAASSLRQTAPPAVALLGPLEGVLRQANPLLRYLRPYALDLATFFPSMESAVHYRDAEGGYARIAIMFSNQLLAGFPLADQQVLTTLERAGLASVISQRQFNPYPRPTEAEHPQPFTGRYPRIEPDPPYTVERRH
jgi:phospholipid/cholesterol/gamma-HCH transport system substrate-binding protein